LAATRRGSFLDGQATHEASQLQKWEAESSDAIADESIQYAVENYSTDPTAIQSAKDNIDIAVATALPGMDENTKQTLKEKKITDLHLAVINDMMVKDAAAAKKYYQDNKKEIDGTQRAAVESKLKELGVKQASQENALKIYAPGKTLTQMQAEVDKLPSDQRDQTLNYIKERYSMFKLDRAEQERAVINAGWEAVTSNPSLDSIPIDVPGANKKVMIDYVLAKQKAATKNKTDIDTDWGLYYKLKKMPHEEFVKEDLLKYRAKMADSQFKELVDLQVKEQKDQKVSRVRSLTAMANDALESAGMVEQKKNQERSQRRDLFFNEFEKEVARFEEGGKKISNQEAQKILDSLLIKSVDKMFDKWDKYAFETGGERPTDLPENGHWSTKYNAWVVEKNGKTYRYVPDEGEN
jgi:hypothetical protein